MVTNKSRAATGAKSNRNDASMWKKGKLASRKTGSTQSTQSSDRVWHAEAWTDLLSPHWAVLLPASDRSLSTLPGLLMLTVKLLHSTSRTEQDAEGYRLTVVWFHTTFGQTSQHDSAVWLHGYSLAVTPLMYKHSNTLAVIPWCPFPLHLTELRKCEVLLILSLCSFLSSSSLNRACQANTADYKLMFGLGGSVVPPSGSMSEISPLCSVRLL